MTVTVVLNIVEVLKKVARYNSRGFFRCRISIIREKYDSLAQVSRRLQFSLFSVLAERRSTLMVNEGTRNSLL